MPHFGTNKLWPSIKNAENNRSEKQPRTEFLVRVFSKNWFSLSAVNSRRYDWLVLFRFCETRPEGFVRNECESKRQKDKNGHKQLSTVTFEQSFVYGKRFRHKNIFRFTVLIKILGINFSKTFLDSRFFSAKSSFFFNNIFYYVSTRKIVRYETSAFYLRVRFLRLCRGTLNNAELSIDENKRKTQSKTLVRRPCHVQMPKNYNYFVVRARMPPSRRD